MNKFEEIKGIIDLKKLQNERKHEIQNASDAELRQKCPMNIFGEELYHETQSLKITKLCICTR